VVAGEAVAGCELLEREREETVGLVCVAVCGCSLWLPDASLFIPFKKVITPQGRVRVTPCSCLACLHHAPTWEECDWSLGRKKKTTPKKSTQSKKKKKDLLVENPKGEKQKQKGMSSNHFFFFLETAFCFAFSCWTEKMKKKKKKLRSFLTRFSLVRDRRDYTTWSRGLPPTKARYCSMVSFGGVETGKS